MKILNDDKHASIFVLIMDKREARTLLEIAEAAHKANKRRGSFRTWLKNLEEQLCCF
ncbi:MAG: hypothetical protein AB2792_01745 [Candidatus Thiodiazotropha sp.]